MYDSNKVEALVDINEHDRKKGTYSSSIAFCRRGQGSDPGPKQTQIPRKALENPCGLVSFCYILQYCSNFGIARSYTRCKYSPRLRRFPTNSLR